MVDDILELAAIAYSSWAAAVQLYYPDERPPIWEQLDEDDTRPWIAVAEVACEPSDRSSEPDQITYEFEHEPRSRKGKHSGRKVGPQPPRGVRLRRPTAEQVLRSQAHDDAEQDLRLALYCSTSLDDACPFDWPWMQRTHPEDAGALRALVLCGWTTLQHELHDAWRDGELQIAAERALAEVGHEVLEHVLLLEQAGELPRQGVLDACESHRIELSRRRTVDLDESEPMPDAVAKTAAERLLAGLPDIPDWFELTADGDNVTRDIWRQVAEALAKSDGDLRLFTPGLGFDRLSPKRTIETGDIVMRRKGKGERGVLTVVATVCGVELGELLRLHHDDYERVLMYGDDLLGKSVSSASTRSSKLSVRLRRCSAPRSRSRSPSTT